MEKTECGVGLRSGTICTLDFRFKIVIGVHDKKSARTIAKGTGVPGNPSAVIFLGNSPSGGQISLEYSPPLGISPSPFLQLIAWDK